MKKGIDFTGIVVCFICHDGNGNYLFGKRSKNARDEHGRWDTGGGGLKFGETLDACLRRELKEEVCADPIEISYLGYHEAFREQNGVPTHWLAHDFKVLVDPKQVKIGEPEMCDELCWARLDAPPEPLHSYVPYTLEKYKDQLN